METLEPLLKQHPFFKDLHQDFIKLIVGCASNRYYKAGTFMFQEGEQANEFFLIRQGLVALELVVVDGESIELDTVGPGEILGWSWLLPPYFWHFNARVQQDVRVFALDGLCIRKKCEENHTLGYEMLKRFAQIMEKRLYATRLQLLDLYAKR